MNTLLKALPFLGRSNAESSKSQVNSRFNSPVVSSEGKANADIVQERLLSLCSDTTSLDDSQCSFKSTGKRNRESSSTVVRTLSTVSMSGDSATDGHFEDKFYDDFASVNLCSSRRTSDSRLSFDTRDSVWSRYTAGGSRCNSVSTGSRLSLGSRCTSLSVGSRASGRLHILENGELAEGPKEAEEKQQTAAPMEAFVSRGLTYQDLAGRNNMLPPLHTPPTQTSRAEIENTSVVQVEPAAVDEKEVSEKENDIYDGRSNCKYLFEWQCDEEAEEFSDDELNCFEEQEEEESVKTPLKSRGDFEKNKRLKYRHNATMIHMPRPVPVEKRRAATINVPSANVNHNCNLFTTGRPFTAFVPIDPHDDDEVIKIVADKPVESQSCVGCSARGYGQDKGSVSVSTKLASFASSLFGFKNSNILNNGGTSKFPVKFRSSVGSISSKIIDDCTTVSQASTPTSITNEVGRVSLRASDLCTAGFNYISDGRVNRNFLCSERFDVYFKNCFSPISEE